MKHEDYFPLKVAEQRAWAVRYKTNLPTYATLYGYTEQEVTLLKAYCDAIISGIDAAELAKAAAKQKNKDKNKAIKDNMDLLRPEIKIQKASTVYTPGIGAALGIVGSEISFDPAEVKTKVSLSKAPNGVEIKFTLEHTEGGFIYSKRGSETEFAFFKHVTHPHAVDTRPNLAGTASEERNYYVYLALNDEEIGKRSDIASILY